MKMIYTQIYLTRFYYCLSRMWMIIMLNSDHEHNFTIIKGNESFDISRIYNTIHNLVASNIIARAQD